MIEQVLGVIKQGMENIGKSGKNAQVDGSLATTNNITNENKKEEMNGKDKVLNALGTFAKSLKNASDGAKVDGIVSNPVPIDNMVLSDERLKDIFGEETPIDCFAKIHSYEFEYTPEAQEMMKGEDHVDDKEHLGVMAQELLENPATSACVIKDTDGFLKVDTAQLTMANTATIAELSRKVQKLEEIIGER